MTLLYDEVSQNSELQLLQLALSAAYKTTTIYTGLEHHFSTSDSILNSTTRLVPRLEYGRYARLEYGLIVCINVQHNVMNMTGQGHVMALTSSRVQCQHRPNARGATSPSLPPPSQP